MAHRIIFSEAVRSLYYHRSLLAQAATRMACWRMLQEAEANLGHEHTFVIYARPDVAWPTAISPHCFWDLHARARLWDWVWMFPRSHGSDFF